MTVKKTVGKKGPRKALQGAVNTAAKKRRG